jgi:hypothetical protein
MTRRATTRCLHRASACDVLAMCRPVGRRLTGALGFARRTPT